MSNDSSDFKWTEDFQERFDRIKSLISSDVMNSHFLDGVPVEVYTDASDVAICGVLLQDGRMIYSTHRKLNSAEVNYSCIERELLGVVFTLCKNMQFLIDKLFTLLWIISLWWVC